MRETQDASLVFIETWREVEEFMTWLGDRRPVLAFDVETTGLDFKHHRIRLAQFGDRDRGWAFRFDQFGGIVRSVFEAYEGQLVAHNAKFDSHFLREAGHLVPADRVDDTMIIAHLVDPQGPMGLKALASVGDPQAGLGAVELDAMFHHHHVDWKTAPIDHVTYWAYGALDTVLTARLHADLMPKLGRSDVYETEMALQQILIRIEAAGKIIGRHGQNEIKGERQELHSKAAKEHNVNLNSTADVIRRLRGSGWEPKMWVGPDQPNVTSPVLSQVRMPLAEMFVEFRRLEELLDRYEDGPPKFRQIASPAGTLGAPALPPPGSLRLKDDDRFIATRFCYLYASVLASFTSPEVVNYKEVAAVALSGGAHQLSADLGISIPEAASMLSRFHDAFPEVTKFRDDCAGAFGLSTKAGRLVKAPKDRRWSLAHLRIEAEVADIVKTAIVESENEVIAIADTGDFVSLSEDGNGHRSWP